MCPLWRKREIILMVLVCVHECVPVQHYWGLWRGIWGKVGLSWCRRSCLNARYAAVGYWGDTSDTYFVPHDIDQQLVNGLHLYNTFLVGALYNTCQHSHAFTGDYLLIRSNNHHTHRWKSHHGQTSVQYLAQECFWHVDCRGQKLNHLPSDWWMATSPLQSLS